MTAPRVLIVEDDRAIGSALEEDLRIEGYAVDLVTNGDAALERVREARFDLILLDVMLPKKDGYEVCRELRRMEVDASIVMLTARSAEAERVLGLDLGADDYITRPYSPRELRARIRARLRRPAAGAASARSRQASHRSYRPRARAYRRSFSLPRDPTPERRVADPDFAPMYTPTDTPAPRQTASSADVTLPAVTVIIPNYNHTQYIVAAIESVLAQSFRSFEIVVVDDGSTDNSREVVAGFGEQVRYVYQENQGLAGARNTGLRAARGKLVGLLDADDVWEPEYLRTMVDLAERHPEAAVYYCRAQAMDGAGLPLPQVFGGPVLPTAALYQSLLRANSIIPSTVLLRRAVIAAAGLFDQQLRSCEDWELWLRLLPEREFVGTEACLVRYRLHPFSLSKDLTGMHQAARATIEKNFGLDDGLRAAWSPTKRRAFGGLYRYFALTLVQQRDEWDRAAAYLGQALRVDPTLARDLTLFYELALGSQPPGLRGSRQQIALRQNAERLEGLLDALFAPPAGSDILPLERTTRGTAAFGLGLAAYNTRELALSRRCLARALWLQPALLRDTRASANLLKSLLGRTLLARLAAARSGAR